MILVSEQNSFHVCGHAFSRPFYAQSFVPMCQRRYFDRIEGILILLIECIIPIVRVGLVYALFGSLASLKIIPLVAPGILYTFFNPLLLRVDNKFKPPQSDRCFLFEEFFQKSLPISMITWRFIFPAIDLLVPTISFITRTFRLLQDLFHIPYRSRNY